MATIVSSIGLRGIEGYRVQVEVQLLPGIEGVSIVGLPDASVKESKDRVMAALYANDCEVPDKKIIINLSPTEEKKNSPFFGLAMAIGIMKEADEFTDKIPEDAAFLGVLSLDGTVKSVEGMLPAIIAAKKEGFKRLYLPYSPDLPIHHIKDIDLHFVETLQETIASFSGQMTASVFTQQSLPKESEIIYHKDFQHVLGHSEAKRALEIAAAGGHHVLMIGPPGCGKSLLAESYPSILPPLAEESKFEVMSIYQLAGVKNDEPRLPPFREPHHSASAVSLIGGGANPKPGEVSLAHHGVLFLDEMAEFPKRTLDMLRQPIETGRVTISRATSTVTYPANFQIIGAMNPCPCGYIGSRHFYCTCPPKQIEKYQNRISGPIEDRIDILLNLQPVILNQTTKEKSSTSEEIRQRVTTARAIQYERYKEKVTNATIENDKLLPFISLNQEQQQVMQKWISQNNWSTRVQMKILRLARTIADLSGNKQITNEALWEAANLRRSKVNRNREEVAK